MLAAVGVVACVEAVAVVGEAIQAGGGYLCVTEDLPLFTYAEVGGQDQRSLFVLVADPMKPPRPVGRE